jgi:hypothetical protein
MSDQPTRVLDALRAQTTRFLDFDLPTRGLKVDFGALADVVTTILRDQEAIDLNALADRLDSRPNDARHWPMERVIGWTTATEAMRSAAVRLASAEPVRGGAR